MSNKDPFDVLKHATTRKGGGVLSYEVNKRDAREVLGQLRFLGREGAIANFMQLREVAKKALELLKGNYPSRPKPEDLMTAGAYPPLRAIKRDRLGLKAGFRVSTSTGKVTAAGMSAPGFVLSNSKADPVKNPKGHAALTQMEFGAAAHVIRLKNKKAFLFGTGSATPTPQGVLVSGGENTPGVIDVPSQPGTHFIHETFLTLLKSTRKLTKKVEEEIPRAVAAKRTQTAKVQVPDDMVPTVPKRPRKAKVSSALSHVDKIRAAIARVKARQG